MFKFLKKIDAPIDYCGQTYSFNLMVMIIGTGYFIALMVGLIMSSMKYILILSILTVVIAFIFTIPPWRYFNRHPLKFKKIEDARKMD